MLERIKIMAYGNPHKKMTYSHNSKSKSSKGGSLTAAAKGPKTPYDKWIGERQAYKITGKVIGMK